MYVSVKKTSFNIPISVILLLYSTMSNNYKLLPDIKIRTDVCGIVVNNQGRYSHNVLVH